LPNDVRLQEGHPVDENLRPIKVGGKSTAIETAQHGNGARVNGDLEVTGDITGNVKDVQLDLTKITSTDLLIDDSGDITLDAGDGDIYFKDDGSSFATFSKGASTKLTLASVGGLHIDSGSYVTLDAHNGEFVSKNAGTEFSATNSAYAGMILGYSMIRNNQGYTGDNTADSKITLNQTSYTLIESVEGTKAGVTFIAPPSGNVEIEFYAMFQSTNDTVAFGLSSSDSSYTEIEDLQTYNSNIVYFDESDYHPISIRWVLEGLSGSNTVYIWYKVLSGTAYLYHGESYHHSTTYHYPPITTKVTALPATITTGE